MEVTGRRGRKLKQLPQGNERILEFERGSTRYHSVENSLWKTLWTCRERGGGGGDDDYDYGTEASQF